MLIPSWLIAVCIMLVITIIILILIEQCTLDEFSIIALLGVLLGVLLLFIGCVKFCNVIDKQSLYESYVKRIDKDEKALKKFLIDHPEFVEELEDEEE